MAIPIAINLMGSQQDILSRPGDGGISIAFVIHSLDHSLSTRLILSGRLRDLLSRSLSGRLILQAVNCD